MIEILVVIVLIALAAAIVAPGFLAGGQNALDREARRLMLKLRLAQEEATLSASVVRWLGFADGYRFERMESFGVWRPVDAEGLGDTMLPQGVRIAEVSPALESPLETPGPASGAEEEKLPLGLAVFGPSGLEAPGRIVLQSEERRRVIELRPGPGGIRIEREGAP